MHAQMQPQIMLRNKRLAAKLAREVHFAGVRFQMIPKTTPRYEHFRALLTFKFFGIEMRLLVHLQIPPFFPQRSTVFTHKAFSCHPETETLLV